MLDCKQKIQYLNNFSKIVIDLSQNKYSIKTVNDLGSACYGKNIYIKWGITPAKD